MRFWSKRITWFVGLNFSIYVAGFVISIIFVSLMDSNSGLLAVMILFFAFFLNLVYSVLVSFYILS